MGNDGHKMDEIEHITESDNLGSDEALTLRSKLRQAVYLLRQTKSAYDHFIPRRLLEILGVTDIVNLHIGENIDRKITIMFSDIRNFTTISENMDSSDTFSFINDYLSFMEPAVQFHNGVIDKFIGDAVMAIFPESAEDAVKAALAMRDALGQFNRRRTQEGLPPVSMGIGLNTGLSTLGVLGHLERLEATIIGDAVNVASRVEGLTKLYRVGLLISEDTLACIQKLENYSIRFVDRVAVRGRIRPVSIYEVFDGDSPALANQKLGAQDIFEKAVAYFHFQEVERALPLFRQCQEAAPEDTVVEMYINRCQKFQESGIFECATDIREKVQWQESFNTGLDDVDAQHQELLNNIGNLSKAIQKNDMEMVKVVLNFLQEYGVNHFATEEAYMEKYKYPFIADHRQEHAAFIRNFLSMRDDLLSNTHDDITSLFRITVFLYDWLISHSTRIDKHFADFVIAQRATAAGT